MAGIASSHTINLCRGIVMPLKGHRMSEEQKHKIADAHRGKPKPKLSEEHKKLISARLQGNQYRKGKKHTPEIISQIAAKNNGKKRSDSTKRKISDALKGRAVSNETRRKLSETSKGRIVSEETRLRISEAGKRRYQNPEERQKTAEQLRKLHTNPIITAKRKATMATPESRAKRSASAKAAMTEDRKFELSVVSAKLAKQRWNNSDYRAKVLTPEYKSNLSNNAKQQWQNQEFRDMMVAKARERFNRMWSDPKRREVWVHQVCLNGSPLNFQSGSYNSTKSGYVNYRSSYELTVYELLDADDDVVTYEVEPLVIPYEFEGRLKSYLPDLLVHYKDGSELVVEIKPESRLDDPQNQAKFEAAQAIYGDHFEVWSEELIFQ